MYIWSNDKYSSTSFKKRLCREKWFWYNQINFSKQVCVAVWCSGQGVACSCRWTGFDSRQHRIFCFFVSFFSFFFLFSLCFLARFFLLACFSLFVLLTLLIMHLDQYIFLSFSPELYFRKGTKLVHHKLFLFTPNNLWRNLTCLLFIVLIITILLP